MAALEAREVPSEGPELTESEPKPLARRFYARGSPVVARDLLGRLLVRRLDGATLVGRVVEAEAYQQDDPASHSFAGRTTRTEVMFGAPGRLYVYFTYGMHFCMNVVTDVEGKGSAVLLRAVEPLEGLTAMARRRGVDPSRPWLLCSGPARLTEAYGVDAATNGVDLLDDDIFIAAGRRTPDGRVGVGPRIGIRKATAIPWRFFELGNRFVSPGHAR